MGVSDISKADYTAYIQVREEEIIEVSDAFTVLVGYAKDVLMRNTFTQLCRILLRSTCDISTLENEGDQAEGFLFNSLLEAIAIEVIFKESLPLMKTIVFQKKERGQLEDRFPFFQKIYEQEISGVAVFATTPQITLLKANQTYLNFLEQPFNKYESSIGKPLQEIVTGWLGSSAQQIWNTALKTGENCYIKEYKYEAFKRGITYWKVMIMPFCEDGGIQYIFEMTEDITKDVINREKMRQQTQVIKEQNEQLGKALSAKEEFFTMMSHEFRTPLNVINSAVQVLQVICGQELSETATKMVNKIKQNTFRQLRLINNILDMAKLSAGKLKSNKRNLDIVLITQAIVESIEVYAKQRQVKLYFNSVLQHQIIGIDDAKYEKILLNLLSNAIKFTPKEKSVSVILRKKAKKVIVEVRDEGIGIPEDKHKHIFEQFGQVKSTLTKQEEGTGVGLSLVKLLVEEMEGEIALTSQEGIGSTFSISLPCERVEEDSYSAKSIESYQERLIQTVHIEFSDIYL